jgi:putative spermidine/putrescine transport system permease protein
VAAGLDAAQRLGRLRRHPAARAIALLAPPLGFFGFFYLAALAVLFVSAFWTVDAFTGALVHHWTTGNFSTL